MKRATQFFEKSLFVLLVFVCLLFGIYDVLGPFCQKEGCNRPAAEGKIYCEMHACKRYKCDRERKSYNYCDKHEEEAERERRIAEAEKRQKAEAERAAKEKAKEEARQRELEWSRNWTYRSSRKSKADPYDVHNYSDADDFADEWEDEFEDWDDAFMYWEDNH